MYLIVLLPTPTPWPPAPPLQAWQASQALQELCQQQSLARIVPRFKSFRVYSKNFLKASALFQSQDNPEPRLKSLKGAEN